MTIPDYEAIRRRLAAATPGLVPYIPPESDGVYRVNNAMGHPVALLQWGSADRRADMLLFAHAPADIAALLARCQALEVQVATLQAGRDASAAATIARLPVIVDPVISEAVRGLDEEA